MKWTQVAAKTIYVCTLVGPSLSLPPSLTVFSGGERANYLRHAGERANSLLPAEERANSLRHAGERANSLRPAGERANSLRHCLPPRQILNNNDIYLQRL